jgi:hypothetical protein
MVKRLLIDVLKSVDVDEEGSANQSIKADEK